MQISSTPPNRPSQKRGLISHLAFKKLALVFTAIVLTACGGGGQEEILVSGSDVQYQPTIKRKGVSYPAVNPAIGGVQAYTSTYSVTTGSAVSFHVSDSSGSSKTSRNVVANVYRLGLNEQLVSSTTIAAKKQSIPTNAWQTCCNWPVSWQMPVASTWKSGLYRADFMQGKTLSSVYFVVRNSIPGSNSKVVLQVPFHTAQAYNNWGNKSLYEFNSSSGVKAERVSMFRPNLAMDGEVYRWIAPFISWAEKENIALEYIASTDMDQQSAPLNGYKLFVTVGHDEYWSAAMRNQFDKFIAGGANAAIFSGNTMWWKIDNITDSYGRKGGLMVATKTQGSSTGNWYESNPEGKSIGASFIKGASIDETANTPATQIGYKVVNPAHWVFAGTNLAAGASFGHEARVLRYEVDGVDFRYDEQGIPRATGGDTVNSSTSILAMTPLKGWGGNTTGMRPSTAINLTGEAGTWGTVTLTQNIGWVFNGGTTDWARGLEPCTATGTAAPICTITKNVIATLGGNVAPPAPPFTPSPPVVVTPPTGPATNPAISTITRFSSPNALGGARFFFSKDAAPATGNWASEGKAFFALNSTDSQSVPIYRFSYTQADGQKRYVLSQSANIGGGWNTEGIAFQAYANAVGTSLAVHEHYKVLSDGWHLYYDVSPSVAGWSYSGAAFYVPSTNIK